MAPSTISDAWTVCQLPATPPTFDSPAAHTAWVYVYAAGFGYGAIKATWLLMASNVFFASCWVDFTWLYQKLPTVLETVFWNNSMFSTVMLVAPPKALLAFW